MDSSSEPSKARVLAQACAALDSGNLVRASEILRAGYPFVAPTKAGRNYTKRQSLRVFYRDGFVDRYSGAQLVHPGVLRLLSIVLPEEFPAHSHWDMSKSHFGFWELFPTINHLVPVSRGGVDDDTNWVTTSMLRNSAKAHWTLDELGWALLPAGDSATWDGMTSWYVNYLTRHPQYRVDHLYLRQWFAATVAVRAELGRVR